MINGVMAGILLLLGTVWAWYALNRLWQESIAESARDGLETASSLGLSIRPPAYRARIVAVGQHDGMPIRVEWRDGLTGPRTLIRRAGRRQILSGLADGPELMAAISAAAM